MERKNNIFKNRIIFKIINLIITFFRKLFINALLLNKHKLHVHSSIKLDIVIPVIDRDFHILIVCIKNLKKYIKNKIDNIYIVSNSHKIEKYCFDNGLIYIDENTILSNYSNSINTANSNRIGWLKQQLIKLHGHYGINDNYLVIDSDHILISDHVFLTNDNKFIFYISSAYYKPYITIIKKLLPIKINYFSYISHKMIINKNILKNLKHDIERQTSKRWDIAIIENIDFNQHSFFSEFELYGNYVCPTLKKHILWKNKDFSRLHFNEHTFKKSIKYYDSITFSYYL